MINISDNVDFSFCNKKEKKIYGNICCYMGVRTRTGCYCFLNLTVCKPYQKYIILRLEKEAKEKK